MISDIRGVKHYEVLEAIELSWINTQLRGFNNYIFHGKACFQLCLESYWYGAYGC